MEPKEKLPLSKSDKLAQVDAELESAMERLTDVAEHPLMRDRYFSICNGLHLHALRGSE